MGEAAADRPVLEFRDAAFLNSVCGDTTPVQVTVRIQSEKADGVQIQLTGKESQDFYSGCQFLRGPRRDGTQGSVVLVTPPVPFSHGTKTDFQSQYELQTFKTLRSRGFRALPLSVAATIERMCVRWVADGGSTWKWHLSLGLLDLVLRLRC